MVIVLMGVSGSGKTTVGRLLARELGWAFYEGDDFHSPSNVAKMKRGVALTDDDRKNWLKGLHQVIEGIIEKHQNGVLACSALKRSYRGQLAQSGADMHFVYLKGNFEDIEKRLEQRKGHFANEELLPSQFDDLEEPRDALTADTSRKPSEIVSFIRAHLAV